MTSRKVGVDSLVSALDKILKEYGREVDDKLKDELQYAGEFAANRARELSPKDTAKYSTGWDYAFTGKGGKLKVEVGNTAKPSLTHLLEKGHMNRDGSWTRGKTHIETAYNQAVELLERRLHG